MRDIYEAIEQNIKKLNFDKLFPKFKQYDFALYNKDEVFLKDKVIPFDERFIGNTTIEYENKGIAIWNLNYKVEDIDVFTSKIVHEMFHAFQLDQKEARFPNEYQGVLYDYNEENLIWKFKETQFLVEAYKEQSLSKFNDFLASRKLRCDKFKILVNYESGIETVEGMAKFIEVSVLEQLKPDLKVKSIEDLLINLQNPKNYIPVRKISYDIGALIMLTAEILGIKYNRVIIGNVENVYEWFDNTKSFNLESLDKIDIDKAFIIKYNLGLKIKIEEFLIDDFEIINNITLTGFDPMNTYKYKKYLIFDHFVRIKTFNEEKNIFGTSCAKLDKENNAVQLYVAKQTKNTIVS